MRWARVILAELIERASTRLIARLLADPSAPLSGLRDEFDNVTGPPAPPDDAIELLTHEDVQRLAAEREQMVAHPPTEPAPPPEEDEPPVGSLKWRARQEAVRQRMVRRQSTMWPAAVARFEDDPPTRPRG